MKIDKIEEAYLKLAIRLFRNRKRILVGRVSAWIGPGEKNYPQRFFTVMEEFSKVGYILEEDCYGAMTEGDLFFAYKELLPKIYKEDSKTYTPLYPGFPQQVKEIGNEKALKNQGELYETLDYSKEFYQSYSGKMIKLANKTNAEIINIKPITTAELHEYVTILLATDGFIAPVDLEIIKNFVVAFPLVKLPGEIRNRNIFAALLELREELEAKDINDVLRLMAIKRGFQIEGKTIREENAAFKTIPRKPSRKDRRIICEHLNRVLEKKGIENCVVDAKRYYNQWVFLGRSYHFKEYAKKYPLVAEFANTLFTPELSKKFKTWNSKVHELYKNLTPESFETLVDFISKRPGEFMRRFDSLLHKSLAVTGNADVVIRALDKIEIGSKLLFSLYNYYCNLDKQRVIRDTSGKFLKILPMKIIPVKTEVFCQLVDDIKTTIKAKILSNVAKKGSTLPYPEATKVFISPELEKIPVPFDMKYAGGLVPVGTKYPIPEDTNIIRLFLAWEDTDGTEDLDLHASFLGHNNYIERVGWNSRISSNIAIHSGDVRKRVGNCVEFVDIDFREAIKNGLLYAIIVVDNYEGRGLNSIPAFIGYELIGNKSKMLTYNKVGSFKYDTVTATFKEDLTESYKSMVAFLVDLNAREIILANLNTDFITTNETYHGGWSEACIVDYLINKGPVIGVAEVAKIWYESKGAEIVNTPEEADEIIDAAALKDYTTIYNMIY